MTRATVLLLLALATIASTYPISTKTSVNRFYGQLFEKYFAEEYDELFNQLYEKFNSFAPGLIKEKDVKRIKNGFVAFFEGEEDLVTLVSNAKRYGITKRIEVEFKKRESLMTEEAQKFDYLQRAPHDTFTENFADFREKYNELSPSAKDSVEAQFPIFGMLDEVEVHVKVADRVLGHLRKMA
ncbi:hypothetical protein PMAYCL1PPCAC_28091 [Pristionchus mayeri]|uniref:Uncharacterized protein n=1 Tax=Pristionchus mayeri TaxID=1317129 RepID=A0AAN5D7N6_9BILA|nr:hypothetical protein PMAYCL1PPCAC_28091 [Pristionchus mayeri]